MKLLLKIAYIGTNYAGYQAQTELPSVQTALTEAVSSAFGFPCSVTGCSRTDAGVHALGFCCAVEPRDPEKRASRWLTVPEGKVHRALARFLPEDISVRGEAFLDDPDFHPRYSVVSKEYRYRMYDSPARDPFLEHRAWRLKRRITDEGLARMNEAGRYLVGKHDFTSFMAAGSKITDATRTILTLETVRRDEMLELRVSADGFLYNMVRILTGTLTDCAWGALEPGDIPAILEARDRTRAGKTAPPDGLYLSDVRYDREIHWKIL